MLDGIGAETVDAELAHPEAQPFAEVVAHAVAVTLDRAGGLLVPEEFRQADRRFALGAKVRQEGQRALQRIDQDAGRRGVVGDAGTYPVPTPPIGPGGVLVVDQVVVGVQVFEGFGLPLRPLLRQVLRHAVAQRAEVVALHVGQGRIAGMVEHHVEQYADAAGVGLGDQLAQVVLAAHVGVQLGEVQCVVAVIGVMAEVALVTAADPAVNLLVGRADPQCADAQFGQVIELAGQPFEIATVEGADFLFAIRLATVAAVVARVAIGETVGQHEIDVGVAPVVDRLGRGTIRFEQQQAAAVGGWRQADPAIVNHGGLAAVAIAQALAVGEHAGDRNVQGFAIPGTACGFGGHTFLPNRQQAQVGLFSGLHQQPIATRLGDAEVEAAAVIQLMALEGFERLTFAIIRTEHQLSGLQVQLSGEAVIAQRLPGRLQGLTIESDMDRWFCLNGHGEQTETKG